MITIILLPVFVRGSIFLLITKIYNVTPIHTKTPITDDVAHIAKANTTDNFTVSLSNASA